MRSTVASFSILLLCSAASAQVSPYRVVDLDLQTKNSEPRGISDDSRTVAGSRNTNGFLWRKDTGFNLLRTLPGYTQSFARAVDANDNACGWVGSESLSPEPTRAVRFLSNGSVENLGTLGGQFSRAWEMNAAGTIVGDTGTDPNFSNWHAFIWKKSTGMVDLLALSLDSHARDVNDFDQVAGGLGNHHAARWTPGVGMIDIGAPIGFPTAFANGINSSGQVCADATSANGDEQVWARFDNIRGWQVLEGLGSKNSALKINDFGQVVGDGLPKGELKRAVMYSDDFGALDLNTLIPADAGWFLRAATDINERGQIVGYGTVRSTGEIHGFRLVPNYMLAYGLGCAGAGSHVPVLGGFGPTTSGNVSLMMAEGNALGAGALFVSTTPGESQIGTCTYLLGTPIGSPLVFAFDSNRQARFTGPLPKDLAGGTSLFFQFASLDHAAPNGSFALSNGLQITAP